MEVKIKMPRIGVIETINAEDMSACEPYLAVRIETGEVVTLVKLDREILVFEEDSAGYISHPAFEWANRNYKIIRKYTTGETLSITVKE